MLQNNARLLSRPATVTMHGEPSLVMRARPLPSIKATLRGELERHTGSSVLPQNARSNASHSLAAVSRSATRSSRSGRTTVLPRRETNSAVTEQVLTAQPRFERIRQLGEGAMGEVELAHDHDIRRRVALKRVLHHEDSRDAVLRFAEEVRVIGQLEHPSIVPIYDVGRDEDGELYLVMKHLNGETMEQILERLRAFDEHAVARFTVEYRLHLFFKVLDAIRYAHARGILHRDLKPANIQIGLYGEVTVLDWGIARPFQRSESKLKAEPLERTAVASLGHRLVETQFGSLAGTPLYMSPEQAAGHNDELDDRSDVYTLSVLLYEWLTLEHPLEHRGTLVETLCTIIAQDYDDSRLLSRARGAGVPLEYVYVMLQGLTRQRHARLQSVAALEEALAAARDGFIPVQCPATLAKRTLSSLARWIDHHPIQYGILFFVALGILLLGIVAMACHVMS